MILCVKEKKRRRKEVCESLACHPSALLVLMLSVLSLLSVLLVLLVWPDSHLGGKVGNHGKDDRVLAMLGMTTVQWRSLSDWLVQLSSSCWYLTRLCQRPLRCWIRILLTSSLVTLPCLVSSHLPHGEIFMVHSYVPCQVKPWSHHYFNWPQKRKGAVFDLKDVEQNSPWVLGP